MSISWEMETAWERKQWFEYGDVSDDDEDADDDDTDYAALENAEAREDYYDSYWD